jgi:hypothetical protein
VERETLFNILRANNFLKSEARRIAYSTVNQYSAELQDVDVIWQSGLVQKAIKSRNIFVNNLRKLGWNDRQIVGTLSAWYRGRASDATTWSFLRREYAVKVSEAPHYKMAVRARARAMVGKLGKVTGFPYGKRLPRPTRSTLVVKPQERFPLF